MSSMKFALAGFSAVLLLFPAVVTSASIAVAAKGNSLDWNHLISKRGTENKTETKNAEVTKDQSPMTIDEITKTDPIQPDELDNQELPSENVDEQQLLDSRTIDWKQLDGNSDDLNDELTARRKRRSLVAARVAHKLASARENDEKNRLRTKRDLSIDDDDDDDGQTGLNERDIENLEYLIYQLQKMNEQPNIDDIDTDDLAYGSDDSAYFQPVVVETDDSDDDDDSALLAQLLASRGPSDDDDDEDEVDYRPKDKRSSYPLSVEESDDDDTPVVEDDESPVIGYIGYPVSVDDEDDDGDEEIAEPALVYDTEEPDGDDESRQQRVEILERRIKQLAQYLNDNYRRR